MTGLLKAQIRRASDPRYASRFFVGDGIDIGGGEEHLGKYQSFYKAMRSCRNWDRVDGDAQFMAGVADNHYDFLHSSHCLEHLTDPFVGFDHWLRIVKPGGYLVIAIPDEDMYEQGFYPSQYNRQHLWTFTIAKKQSWSPKSINLVDFLNKWCGAMRIIKIDLLDHYYDIALREGTKFGLPPDQTRGVAAESGIEFVLQKEPCPATITHLKHPANTVPQVKILHVQSANPAA